MPAVILKSRFVLPNTVKFSSYVDYMSRSNAVYKDGDFDYLQYKEFNEYMDDSKKSTGLFTKHNDFLNSEEKINLKEMFNKAQQNDSVLWQDVFSFDNNWLKENNFLDKENKPDVKLIQEATRKSMDKLFKEEDLESTGIWSAAIHMNTDNVHVHIATVEKNNTRERRLYPNEDGKKVLGFKAVRKPQTLDHMKSSFINTFTNRDLTLGKISSLRNDLYSDFSLSDRLNNKNKESDFYLEQSKKIIKELPDDKRKWNYKNISPEAKKQVQIVINQYKLNNPKYNEYTKLVNQESDYMKSLFGKTSRDSKDYAMNKEEDLNHRLGNRYLKELKENSKELNISYLSEKNGVQSKSTATNYNNKNIHKDITKYKNNSSRIYISKKGIRQITEALGSEIKDQVNIMEYEKVKQEQERESQNQGIER